MNADDYDDPDELCINDIGLEKHELIIVMSALNFLGSNILADMTNGKVATNHMDISSIQLCAGIHQKIQIFIKARESDKHEE